MQFNVCRGQPNLRRIGSLQSDGRRSVTSEDGFGIIASDRDEAMPTPTASNTLVSPRIPRRLDTLTLNEEAVDTISPSGSGPPTGRDFPMSPVATLHTRTKEAMLIPPEDSVYSYLMFMPPVEQRRNKSKVTPLIVFAVLLVAVNFCMQTGLLYVVGQHIMKKHNEWVSNLANLKHTAWYHVIPMKYNRGVPKCHGEDSPLCLNSADGISCAPRSVEILADWHLLDLDGDDIWSREEAESEDLQELVQCKFNVDLLSMYDTTVQNINRSHFLKHGRDTNIRTGVGIHKAYRDWYLHKPLLCQYGDQDMCGTLFMRGFFDEALRQQSSIEFKDTTSAFKYCTELLERECFDILPNTYRVWRLVSNQQCGLKSFGQSTYHNPAEDEHAKGKSMLTVDFKKRIDYDSSRRLEFKLFLVILLVTFSAVMSLEMRSMVKTFIWTWKFPQDVEATDDPGQIVGRDAVRITRDSYDDDMESMPFRNRMTSKTDKDEAKADPLSEDITEWDVRILAIRQDHRLLVFAVTVLRLLLWFFLLWSGVMFLTGPPRYLALIFDALSLVFILEIDEVLYRTMLRTEFKNDHMNVKEMKVARKFGGRHSVVQDILLFVCLIAFSAAIVITYSVYELNPLVDSLECLCTVDGPQCNEARLYSKSWWDTYWSTTMPAATMIIEQLKAI